MYGSSLSRKSKSAPPLTNSPNLLLQSTRKCFLRDLQQLVEKSFSRHHAPSHIQCACGSRGLIAKLLRTSSISQLHARPPLYSRHSSHKVRYAKRTAGRGSRNQGLQTWPHILWVIAVSGRDLKQCSRVWTTFSRERDRLSIFPSGQSLVFRLNFEKVCLLWAKVSGWVCVFLGGVP